MKNERRTTKRSEAIEVYLEIGKKRVFAGAVEWPGWCRSGKDEETALHALLAYAPRYSAVMKAAGLEFRMPASPTAFRIIERVAGNATTEFGAPAIAPSSDSRPLDDVELERLLQVFRGCWRTFDKIVKSAEGKELRKGPRGGGRDLHRIIEHVIGADAAYMSGVGAKFPGGDSQDLRKVLTASRKAIAAALGAAARNELPKRGPRGGTHWSPRYFVRRSAWHVLDHAWEIQDRIL